MQTVGNPGGLFSAQRGGKQTRCHEKQQRNYLEENKESRTTLKNKNKNKKTGVLYRERLCISIIKGSRAVTILYPNLSHSLICSSPSPYTVDPHYLWIAYLQIHLLTGIYLKLQKNHGTFAVICRHLQRGEMFGLLSVHIPG